MSLNDEKANAMHDYSTDGYNSQTASEPNVAYATLAKEHLRVVSEEELARCMTLDESERLITGKINRFYHPEV